MRLAIVNSIELACFLTVTLSYVVFTQAGDPILTYYPSWSVVSSLRQPAAVGAGGLCTESNPAGGSGTGVHQSFVFLETSFLPCHSPLFILCVARLPGE